MLNGPVGVGPVGVGLGGPQASWGLLGLGVAGPLGCMGPGLGPRARVQAWCGCSHVRSPIQHYIFPRTYFILDWRGLLNNVYLHFKFISMYLSDV